jgi:DNA-binding protein Fis
MNEAQLKIALIDYLNEAPSYLSQAGNRYKIIEDIFRDVVYTHALARCKGCRVKAAKLIGINRNTLRTRLESVRRRLK